jgi:large subunit ribosomal protein L25
MAESVTLKTKPRKPQGSQEARRLRRQGQVPAVIYGHKEAAVAVALPEDELQAALRHHARVLDLDAEGKVQKVLIKEIQYDHLGKELLHVDFARVSADEKVKVTVRLELRGQAPGVTAGGVLDQPIHGLEVECLAISIPDSIRVNISEMQIGTVLHVRELTMPPGVKAMADPDLVVVQVRAPEVEEAPVAAAPAAAGAEQAEPEVIGRKVAEKEEEPEK